MPAEPRFGAIEAGGTKWVCGVADADGRLLRTERIPTTTPGETIGRAVAFLEAAGPLRAVGVGSFGPLDLDPASPTHGWITTTPKPGWQHTDLVGPLREALGVPVALDSDVNAAAVGEGRRGAARGTDTFAYITVGTGIGAGVVVGGRPVHGLVHPEFGHVRVPHDRARDPFDGCCPRHGDCLEGLASGAALHARWGRPASEVDDDAAWDVVADHLAAGIANLVFTASPQRVVIGGGVMRRVALLAQVRARVLDLLGGYLEHPALATHAGMDAYVVAPELGDDAGIVGAVELARDVAADAGTPTRRRAAGPAVHGQVAPGFEGVREAFADNLRERGDVGAAFCVMRGDEPLVDLWGGTVDGSRPWQRDTLQVIYSGTKGLVALCLLMLVDRGLLDPDAAVADYWPEFAAEGKAGIRVAEVVSHRGRMPGFVAPVRHDEVVDDRRMAALLAAQPAEDDPRAVDVYHPLTFGWLCGELLRRIDGRSIGRFFAEEVAAPLGLEIWIGLPPALERRVSTLATAPGWGTTRPIAPDAFARDELLRRTLANPPLFPAGWIPSNDPAWHQAEIPGAGAIATAWSMARLYACLAAGGELDGVRLLGADTLERVGRRELSRRIDPLVDHPQAFGFGFQLQTDPHPLGPPGDAFGHGGAGGSMHGAWPSQGVGFSYAMNLLRDDHPVDPRVRAVLDATHEALP